MLPQSKRIFIKVFVVIFFVVFGFVNAQPNKVTSKQSNYLREGPAVFYHLLDILPFGEEVRILELKENWSKVKTPKGIIGWMSNNSFEKVKSNIVMSELAKKWASKNVSKISLAGAIKGLLGKMGKTNEGDFTRLLKLTHNDINNFQVNNFIEELNLHKSENRNEIDWDDANLTIPEFDPGFKEQQIGFGIASRLARKPMIINSQIRDYLYLIMNALLEKSEFYDYEFNIFLLNDANPDGFSCPGGFIFITTGVFNVCKDESELAAAIAHEIGHQILQHATKELSKRETFMKADNMFSEMDKEIGKDKSSGLESDFVQQIATSYEKVVHYRTLIYEEDADKASAILLANAGYDPFAIGRLTQRLAKMYVADTNIFSENYLAPNDMKLRAGAIKSFLLDNFSKDEAGARLKNRFNNNYKILFK